MENAFFVGKRFKNWNLKKYFIKIEYMYFIYILYFKHIKSLLRMNSLIDSNSNFKMKKPNILDWSNC